MLKSSIISDNDITICNNFDNTVVFNYKEAQTNSEKTLPFCLLFS